MIIGKINLGQSFEDGIPRWVKCDIEATPEGDETPEQVLDKIKQIIEGWQKVNNPNVGNLFGPDAAPQNTPPPVINRAHERLKDQLADCTTFEELYKYADEVKAANNPDVTRAYDETGIQLFKMGKK